jgi:heat shock protein HtpX
MAVNFIQLIRENNRRSWILVICFAVFLGILGGLIGYALGFRFGAHNDAEALTIAAGATGFALFIAAISGVSCYYGGAAAILATSGARPLAPASDPQLQNVVEEMALAAGLPVPKVYMIDDTAPNDFATGRDPEHAAIAVTTGLRDKLTRDELQGVIGHEMSHIKHYDIRFAVLLSTLVGAVALLCDFFLRYGGWGGGRRSRDDDRKGGGLEVILLVLAILLAIVAPIIAKILEMSFSREREYLADAGSVELTRNPEGLISALKKISDDPDVLEEANRATAPLYIVHPVKNFEDRASSILDSHPPIKDRIARLRSLTV